MHGSPLMKALMRLPAFIYLPIMWSTVPPDLGPESGEMAVISGFTNLNLASDSLRYSRDTCNMPFVSQSFSYTLYTATCNNDIITNLYNNGSFLKGIHSWAVYQASNLSGWDIWITNRLAGNASNIYSIIDVINLLAQINTWRERGNTLISL